MIDDEQRPRHWIYTSLLAIGVVAVILACVFLMPFLVVELNSGTFLSFPFGYYMAAQGIIIGLIILVYWMAIRQETTDQKFGATEDL
jgi:putative solute:sodium symporter small subunit